ncbi:ATP-binding protein [Thalassotalea mangrovi]|uniref:histidine kinase n=1 Tax=Thalassotalea mangrovi TaxID=2572245 RepID=A0A4U1B7X0_9GAMM|nr:ATP-binding protein [Thalassotalea mangrovi]TKB46657.1 HAMP domain-containing protein [Thalassotalea mangrovi]
MTWLPKRWYSSLFIKIFLGFWLVALTSMLVTRWLSIQFAAPPEAAPLNFQQQKLLQDSGRKIQQSLARLSIDAPVNLQQWMQNNRRLPPNTWLYERSTARLYSNSPAPKPHLKKRLRRLNFPQPVAQVLPGYLLLGPQTIQVQDRELQLYVGRPVPRSQQQGFFKRLPDWARSLSLIAVSALLCGALTWLLIKPLKRLTLASRQFGHGELSLRVPEFEQRHDELGELGQAFNRMAEEINQHLTTHKRLLGDVSHELRSPLTRLQLLITLMEKQATNTPRLQENLRRCRNEVELLDDMVGKALALSKLENQIQPLNRESIDMRALCQQIVDEYEVMAGNKDIQITMTTPGADGHLSYCGDLPLLYSAISNILENAIKYSPRTGVINVTLDCLPQHLVIGICDQGPGVAESDLARIFTPFYRQDNSRNRNTGGTGLGLAIAMDAIKRHNGEIRASNGDTNSDNPGLSVRIELPYDNQQHV